MPASVLLTSLLIVVARVVDVSMATMRTIWVVQGKRGKAAVLGFFEILIWITVVSGVIQNLDQPFYMVAYALGFALGTYVGIGVEARVGTAQQALRVFTRKGVELCDRLRAMGYVVTRFEGEGREGPISLLFMEADRKRIPAALGAAVEADPDAFCIVDDVRHSSGARLRADVGGWWRPLRSSK